MPENAPQINPKQEQRKSHWLEAGALAIGLLTQAHPEAKALEIKAYTPWVVGVQDDLRQSVMHRKTEFSTVYARFSDGSGVWLRPQRGQLTSSSRVPEHDAGPLSFETRQREVADLCYIHTHPYEIYVQGKGLGTGAYNPPSDVDITFSRNAQQWHQSHEQAEININFAVADISGIWYFRGKGNSGEKRELVTMTGNRLGSEARNQWHAAASDFVQHSLDVDFKFDIEYKKLQQAYNIYLNADIRFVPYEKLTNEPACAGEKFDPKKK